MNKANKEISVLICTRNGARTISEAVAGALASLEAWHPEVGELIVVDNGSSDGTPTLIQAACAESKIACKMLTAPQPGKVHALLTGVRAAEAEIVCIVDDDNVVEFEYFRKLHEFLATYPEVGVVGGANQLDPRIQAPPWFDWGKRHMACARAVIDEGVVIDAEQREIGGLGWIAGAGMGFRKKPLLDAIDAGYTFFNDAQRSKGLGLSGEDMEMCLLFRSMGYRFGYDPRMRLRHNIASGRFKLDAFWSLCRTIGAGSPGMDPFLFTSKRSPGRMPLKWRWQWQLLRKLKGLAIINAPWGMTEYFGEERRFRRRIATEQYRGAIARLLAERSKCDAHTRNVASGPWTRYRVR